MTKTLVKGDWYTVTTASTCTITDANGTPLGTAEAGKQVSFQASTEQITFSDDSATVLVNPKHAPVAAGNGGETTTPTLYPVAPALKEFHMPPEVHDLGGVAVGSRARGDGYMSSVFGEEASGNGESTVAVGHLSKATAFRAIAVGDEAQAAGPSTIALGEGAVAEGEDFGEGEAIAVGAGAKATNVWAIALGSHATANDISALALGAYAKAGLGGIAIGRYAEAGKKSIAIGAEAVVDGSGIFLNSSNSTFGLPMQGDIVLLAGIPNEYGGDMGATQIIFAAIGSPLANMWLDGKAGIIVNAHYGDKSVWRCASWEELLPHVIS